MKNRHFIALLIIVIIAVVGYRVHQAIEGADQHFNTEVHVHADFAVYMEDTKLDFGDAKYQSSVGDQKSEHVHLHDGDGKVVHRHAEGVTFAEFLSSIGYSLNNDCFTNDTGKEFCTNASSSLRLYVNNNEVADKTSYIPQEEDKILLTYGPKDQDLTQQFASITNDSCIQSGTCPERGLPTQESCGLTCEVTQANAKVTLKQIVTYVITGHY